MEISFDLLATLMPGDWFARRRLLMAVRAELHEVVVMISFALRRVLEDRASDREIQERYFALPLRMRTVEVLRLRDLPKLPGGRRMEWWADEVASLNKPAAHPLAFRIIELLAALHSRPLSQAPSRETLRFVTKILNQPEVTAFRKAYCYSTVTQRTAGS